MTYCSFDGLFVGFIIVCNYKVVDGERRITRGNENESHKKSSLKTGNKPTVHQRRRELLFYVELQKVIINEQQFAKSLSFTWDVSSVLQKPIITVSGLDFISMSFTVSLHTYVAQALKFSKFIVILSVQVNCIDMTSSREES